MRPRWWIAILVTMVPAVASADDEPRVIDLRRALELASSADPSARISQAQIEISEARVDRIEAARGPSVTAALGVGATGAYPPNLADPVATITGKVTGRYRLWDFGQLALERAAAVAAVDGDEIAFEGVQRDLAERVELAYVEVVARRELVEVARSTVETEERHVAETEGFVAAGARAEIELAQARATLADARVALVTAENEADVARVSLEQTMAVSIEEPWDVEVRWPDAVRYEDGDLDTLVAEAKVASTDLDVRRADREAAALSLSHADRSNRPVIDLQADVGGSLLDGTDAGASWSVGVTLSWSIWDGGTRRADIREARANLEIAEAYIDSTELELRATVESARLAVRAAKERRRAVDASVDAATEQLRLADGRFSAGTGSATELADAQQRVTTARGQAVDADYQLAVARARLRRLLARTGPQ